MHHIIDVSGGTLSPSILFLNPALHRIYCLCNILQTLLTLWPNLNVKVTCGICRFKIKETYVKLSLELTCVIDNNGGGQRFRFFVWKLGRFFFSSERD